jgi:hypothetical protein
MHCKICFVLHVFGIEFSLTCCKFCYNVDVDRHSKHKWSAQWAFSVMLMAQSQPLRHFMCPLISCNSNSTGYPFNLANVDWQFQFVYIFSKDCTTKKIRDLGILASWIFLTPFRPDISAINDPALPYPRDCRFFTLPFCFCTCKCEAFPVV